MGAPRLHGHESVPGTVSQTMRDSLEHRHAPNVARLILLLLLMVMMTYARVSSLFCSRERRRQCRAAVPRRAYRRDGG